VCVLARVVCACVSWSCVCTPVSYGTWHVRSTVLYSACAKHSLVQRSTVLYSYMACAKHSLVQWRVSHSTLTPLPLFFTRLLAPVPRLLPQVDLAEKSAPGKVYNVCSNRAIKVRELLHTLLSTSPIGADVALQEDPSRFRAFDEKILLGDNSKLIAVSVAPRRRAPCDLHLHPPEHARSSCPCSCIPIASESRFARPFWGPTASRATGDRLDPAGDRVEADDRVSGHGDRRLGVLAARGPNTIRPGMMLLKRASIGMHYALAGDYVQKLRKLAAQ
jgi:hypothetical protein